MKQLIYRITKLPKRVLALLLALVIMLTVVSLFSANMGGAKAATVPGNVITNYPYDPQTVPVYDTRPMTSVNWTKVDHPGYDTAYTAAISAQRNGTATPEHVVIKSTTATFFGYDMRDYTDSVSTSDYGYIGSVDFRLIPVNMDFHTFKELSAVFGDYRIVLKADRQEGTTASLVLMQGNTVVSTYLSNIPNTSTTPINCRLVQSGNTVNIYINGNQVGSVTTSIASRFGFTCSYFYHDCPRLTIMQIDGIVMRDVHEKNPSAVTTSAIAQFVDYKTGEQIATQHTRNGYVGQEYKITIPQTIEGGWIYLNNSRNTNNLDPLTYGLSASTNTTRLFYGRLGVTVEYYVNGVKAHTIEVPANQLAFNSVYTHNAPASYNGAVRTGSASQSFTPTTTNPTSVLRFDYQQLGLTIEYRRSGLLHSAIVVPESELAFNVGYEHNAPASIYNSGFRYVLQGEAYQYFIPTAENPYGKLVYNYSDQYDNLIKTAKVWHAKTRKVGDVMTGSSANPIGVEVGDYIRYYLTVHTRANLTGSTQYGDPKVFTTQYKREPRTLAEWPTAGPGGATIFYSVTTNQERQVKNVLYPDGSYNQTISGHSSSIHGVTSYNVRGIDSSTGVSFNTSTVLRGTIDSQIFNAIDTLGTPTIGKQYYTNRKLYIDNPPTVRLEGGGFHAPSATIGVYLNGTFLRNLAPGEFVELTPEAYPILKSNPSLEFRYVSGGAGCGMGPIVSASFDHHIYKYEELTDNNAFTLNDIIPNGLVYVGNSGVFPASPPEQATLISLPYSVESLTNGTHVYYFDVRVDKESSVNSPDVFRNNATARMNRSIAVNLTSNYTYHKTGTVPQPPHIPFYNVIEHFREIGTEQGLKSSIYHYDLGAGSEITRPAGVLNNIVLDKTYRYVGYSIDGGAIQYRNPPNRVLTNINADHEIIYYYETDPVLTVNFYEHTNVPTTNVLSDSYAEGLTKNSNWSMPGNFTDVIFKNGYFYRFVGYNLNEGGGYVASTTVPDPVYSAIESSKNLSLYFKRDPVVITKFFRYNNGPTTTVLKPEEMDNVISGSDYNTSSSQLVPIDRSGEIYNYIGYDLRDGTGFHTGPPPVNPTFGNVTSDKEIRLYFDNKPAVIIHFLEYQNDSNILANDVSFIVPKGSNFNIDNMYLDDIVASNGKTYTYKAYKWDDQAGMTVDASPTGITNIQTNREVWLYFRTSYSLTEKFHENKVPGEGETLPAIIPDTNTTVYSGDDYTGDPPAEIRDGTYIWTYVGYKHEYDTETIINGRPPAPTYESITSDKTIIYCYEKTLDPNPSVTIIERFREKDNTSNILQADNSMLINVGSNYNPAPGTPPNQLAKSSIDYVYYGYQINNGPVIVGLTPPPEILNITSGHTITYLYSPKSLDYTLHLRQIVLGYDGSTALPYTGYFNLRNDGVTANVMTPSNKDGEIVAYRDFSIALDGGDMTYFIDDIIPQYYKYVGYKVSTTEAANPSSAMKAGIGSHATADFTNDHELWVTVYIEPTTNTPDKHIWDFVTNYFGKIYAK